MILNILGHGFRYELENICRLFFPFDKIEVRDSADSVDGRTVTTIRDIGRAGATLTVRFDDGEYSREKSCTLARNGGNEAVCDGGEGKADGTNRTDLADRADGTNRTDGADRADLADRTDRTNLADLADRTNRAGRNADFGADDGFENECERLLAVLLYQILGEYTGMQPKWGILTGVRPGKLMRRMVDSVGKEEARKYFSERLLVSDEKIDLASQTSDSEERIIGLSKPDSFSLYVSVPFCPTRCSYCSFVSHSIEQAKRLIEPYIDLVCKEIAYTGEIAKRLGLHLETVYIGGGTPTAISADGLSRIMESINGSFDLSACREFTVEAGRPDTVDDLKLAAIKQNGATRISINPQTMCDAVLENIGRRHTAEQTVTAFKMARSHGFDNINMDLIAGLPGDTYETFCDTVEEIMRLDPESVTVHTLSMKRSSSMTSAGCLPEAEAGRVADKMLRYARERFAKAEFNPYYLYRQSRTVGNLENTGFSKAGYEGLYNIYIMDETHTILACGASGVTKLKAQNGHIERIFNYKYPYEYIDRFEEMINRKKGIEEFYLTHPIK